MNAFVELQVLLSVPNEKRINNVFIRFYKKIILLCFHKRLELQIKLSVEENIFQGPLRGWLNHDLYEKNLGR